MRCVRESLRAVESAHKNLPVLRREPDADLWSLRPRVCGAELNPRGKPKSYGQAAAQLLQCFIYERVLTSVVVAHDREALNRFFVLKIRFAHVVSFVAECRW